jgi:hypothetical protein
MDLMNVTLLDPSKGHPTRRSLSSACRYVVIWVFLLILRASIVPVSVDSAGWQAGAAPQDEFHG